MSDSLEKQLFNIFAMAWEDAAPSRLGSNSTLGQIAQREASGSEVREAVEIAPAFPMAFAAKCSGALSGEFICLFKKEDSQQIELFISKLLGTEGGDGLASLLNAALETTAASLPEQAGFANVATVELAGAEIASQLSRVVGDQAWVNTFTLTVGERLNSQMLAIYAPQGSIEVLQAAEAATAATAAAAPGGFTNKRRAGAPREDASRNIERLLDVELEVVVRFGLTQIPLRELVRIGVGSMIELNRQVDEPVELLVNNRSLARGSVVVVDGYYGVCITEIGQPEERRQSLTKM